MHRFPRPFSIGICLVTLLACSPQPGDLAETTAPLYVDATGGGHGPWTIYSDSGLPSYGFADLWDNLGNGRMVRGDFGLSSGHVGYTFTVASVLPGAQWIVVSPSSTGGWACAHTPTGPIYAPCQSQTPSPVGLQAGLNSISWVPTAVILGYAVTCPYVSGMTHFHQCTGVNALEDGSGYVAGQVTDAFGNVLHASNANSLADDCIVDLATYGIQGQLSAPAGYQHGTQVVAVYAACP